MPHNVTVIKKTATSVTLQVAKKDQTGGLPVTSWMVKYQADGAADEDVVTVFFDPGLLLLRYDVSTCLNDFHRFKPLNPFDA